MHVACIPRRTMEDPVSRGLPRRASKEVLPRFETKECSKGKPRSCRFEATIVKVGDSIEEVYNNVAISRISNTSRGHLCILSRKYFPIASDSVDRENHNIYIMAFALKGKVLKFVKENVISACKL